MLHPTNYTPRAGDTVHVEGHGRKLWFVVGQFQGEGQDCWDVRNGPAWLYSVPAGKIKLRVRSLPWAD